MRASWPRCIRSGKKGHGAKSLRKASYAGWLGSQFSCLLKFEGKCIRIKIVTGTPLVTIRSPDSEWIASSAPWMRPSGTGVDIPELSKPGELWT